MGSSRSRSAGGSLTILVVGVMVVMMGVFEVPNPIMGRGDEECKVEQRLLVNGCRAIIFGGNPSASCCQRVRVTHVECVCPLVTPKVAALLGVERTIKQIESCGRTVPHNFTCGSITTP